MFQMVYRYFLLSLQQLACNAYCISSNASVSVSDLIASSMSSLTSQPPIHPSANAAPSREAPRRRAEFP
jgi:hypothetical protein